MKDYLDQMYAHVPEIYRYLMVPKNITQSFSKPSENWTTYDVRGMVSDVWLIREWGNVVMAQIVGNCTSDAFLWVPGCRCVRLPYIEALRWAYDFVENGTTWD